MTESSVSFSARIRNLGPIHRADIQLHPLTLLIGPNNSGKSVAATVLHVITASSPPSLERSRRVLRRRLLFRANELDELLGPDRLEELLKELSAVPDGDPDWSPTEQSHDALDSLTVAIFDHYGRQLVDALQTAFGSDLDDIVRIQDGRRMPGRLEVASAEPAWCISIRFGRPQPRVEILKRPSLVGLARRLSQSDMIRFVRRMPKVRSAGIFASDLAEIVGAELFSSFPQSSYYLPAARSGILQSHRTLAAALVRSSTRAGIEDMSVPKVSGLIADFISEVLELVPRRRRSDFGDIASYLEEGILRGRVAVDVDARYPEISYNALGLDVPLHRTSSMVSELAPVVLYLRYILNERDLLVIEEPESHLHPENQLLVARAISRLASRGLRMAVTTHSDYLVQSISNAVRATSSGERAILDDLAGPQGLPVDHVGAYLFRPTGESSTDTERINVTPDVGISSEEFARVTELLYRETVRLDHLVLR